MTPLLLVFLFMGSPSVDSLGHYQFVSPLPGSTNNNRESTIIIREGSLIQSGTLSDGDVLVNGTESGVISGELILSPDERTLIFRPHRPFAAGEDVRVAIVGEVLTREGAPIPPADFTFGVSPFVSPPDPYGLLPELRPDSPALWSETGKAFVDSVPSRFPQMEIEMFDSAAVGDGYIFLAVASEVDGVGYYLMMLHNDGTPFFARELKGDYAYDFKLQPNGLLTYAHFFEHHSYTGGGNVVHKIMDHSFTLVDSVQMGNGYVAEAHDFQILPNGHYLLFGYYLTPVDMSRIVEGGRPDALVSGGVVQELDVDKNVVFQWRTWDHFSFGDYPYSSRQATRAVVSAFHLNTINLDDDGHIILATPSFGLKINRQTGAVIWNLGGPYNEFSFVNVDSADGLEMVGGHMFHRIPNGSFLLYDNGDRRGMRTSRAHELRLDEDIKTVEVAWTYEPDSLISGWHRGNAQRLPNGNTVIGWGGSSGKPSPAMTEVTPAGRKVFELSFVPPAIESYRAFRFPFAGGEPAVSVVLTEIAPGNTYAFEEPGGLTTGVSVQVNELSGSGYNELTVSRYNYAPLNPSFPAKAPRVRPERIVLDGFNVSGIQADVLFDLDEWAVNNPDSIVVYHREFEEKGLFVPLATMHNPAKNVLSASTGKMGEFVLASPDFSAVVFPPLLVSPADSDSVNQTMPVRLEWTPVGYATGFDLQVATDDAFSDPVVDEQSLRSAVFEIDTVAANSDYYWRVRSINQAGVSAWASVRMFSTTEPFIRVTEPTGGEEWTSGLDHYIRWEDDIEEDVVIVLLKDGAFVDTLAETPSDGAFLWEVTVGLEAGSDYAITVTSIEDNAVSATSAPFSIVTTTSTDPTDDVPQRYALVEIYPNPFSSQATITFQLPVAGHVSLSVFDVRGVRIRRLVDSILVAGSHQILFDASGLTDGVYLYRLETAAGASTGKMVLMR